MARFSNKEFLEKCEFITLLAYSYNPNINPIVFDCFDVGTTMRYTIPRDEVVAELDKRYGRSPTAKKKMKKLKKAKKAK